MTFKTLFHIGPRNLSEWHPVWIKCYKSWQETHKNVDVKLTLYNDEQDLKDIIKRYKPEYLSFFNNLPFKINKIDFARLILLYYEGGMYTDLDVFCYISFLQHLNKDIINLLEAGSETGFNVQPTILACEQGNNFIKNYIENIFQIFESGNLFVELVDISKGKDKTNFIFNSTGVGNCNLTFKSYIGTVNILPYKEYNYCNDYFTGVKTQHQRTGVYN